MPEQPILSEPVSKNFSVVFMYEYKRSTARSSALVQHVILRANRAITNDSSGRAQRAKYNGFINSDGATLA